MVKRLPILWKTRVGSLDWEECLEKEMATHSSILAWKIHGWRSVVGYSPWVTESWTLSDFTFTLHFLVTRPFGHLSKFLT